AIVSGVEMTHEGDVVHLVDENDRFIAKAYYGKQNKGIGWVLTNHKQTEVDDAFFQSLIKKAINTRLSSSVLEYKMTKCTSKWTTFFILTYIPNYIQNDL